MPRLMLYPQSGADTILGIVTKTVPQYLENSIQQLQWVMEGWIDTDNLITPTTTFPSKKIVDLADEIRGVRSFKYFGCFCAAKSASFQSLVYCPIRTMLADNLVPIKLMGGTSWILNKDNFQRAEKSRIDSYRQESALEKRLGFTLREIQEQYTREKDRLENANTAASLHELSMKTDDYRWKINEWSESVHNFVQFPSIFNQKIIIKKPASVVPIKDNDGKYKFNVSKFYLDKHTAAVLQDFSIVGPMVSFEEIAFDLIVSLGQFTTADDYFTMEIEIEVFCEVKP